LNLIKIEKTW